MTTTGQAMSVGRLRDTLNAITVPDTDDPDDHMIRVHPTKDVLVRHDGRLMPLTTVVVTFVDGRFALILDADQ